MFDGVLIMESLRVGATLADLNLVVREIRRVRPSGTSADQPDVWSMVEFQIQDDDAPKVAQVLADALAEPGWYADFRSEAETYVVFHGRIFHYPRGDKEGRAEAEAHGRSLGVPEGQLDWPV